MTFPRHGHVLNMQPTLRYRRKVDPIMFSSASVDLALSAACAGLQTIGYLERVQ